MSGEAAKSEVGVGTIVAGTYEIVRILGRGGMGSVWEGHHTRLPGKRVAIKVLHATVAEDPESLARFRREAEIACRLGHPNIVEVHDFNKLDGGSPYLILELLEGTSLDERLRGGAISIEDCESYLRQIGSALQCAHAQGVIHRDLKPQNIFLVPSPSGVGPEIIKVLDFGISKIRGSQTVKTQDSTLLGTPQYMAPEQAVGHHENVDARTDIFALGAMLYELLSGHPPFSGQNIPEVVYKVVHVEEPSLVGLVPGLSEAKANAIHKSLAKKQDDRFSSVDELVLAFTGEALPAARGSSLERISSGAKNVAIGAAETLDSSKIDLAKAATVASVSSEMPVAMPPPEDIASGLLGSAATIDSSKLDKEALASVGLEPSAAGAEIARSGTGRVALIGLVLVGVAAIAFMLTRGDSSNDASDTTSTPVTNSKAAAVARPDASMIAVLEPLDASVAVLDAGDIATAHRQPDAGIKRRPKRDLKKSVDTESVPTNVAKLLDEAKGQLQKGHPQKAISLAREANKLQATRRGYVLQATAFCKMGDLTSFNQVVARLPKVRRQKAQRRCKKFGR